jgi:hypothetical protein
MNVETAISRVRDELGRPPGIESQAEEDAMLRLTREAQTDVFRAIDPGPKRKTIPLVENQVQYEVPRDLMFHTSINFHGWPLRRVSLEKLRPEITA